MSHSVRIYCLLVSLSAVLFTNAEACNQNNEFDAQDLIVAPEIGESRVYINSTPLSEVASRSKKRSYLIPGDIVSVETNNRGNDGKDSEGANLVCIKYRPQKKRKVFFGWIPRAVLGRLTSEISELGTKEERALKNFQNKDWPNTAKRTTDDFNIKIQKVKSSPKRLQLVIDEGMGIQKNGKEVLVLPLTDDGYLENKDKCGYVLYNLNNGVIVRTKREGVNCWGQHGDFDPEGTYQ